MPKTRNTQRKTTQQPQQPKQHNIALYTRKNTIKENQLRDVVVQQLRQPRDQFEGDSNCQMRQELIDREKLICPICLEIMIFPVLTPCAHAFCLPCIEESLKHTSSCSLCREELCVEGIFSSTFMEQLISNHVSNKLKEDELLVFLNRIQCFSKSDLERRINGDIQVGDFVDYYSDQEWREGKVAEILKNEVLSHHFWLRILPKILQDDTEMHEFRSDSRLIARHRSFTKEYMFRGSVPHLTFQFRNESIELMHENRLMVYTTSSRVSFPMMMMSGSLGRGGRRVEMQQSDDSMNEQIIRFTFNFRSL